MASLFEISDDLAFLEDGFEQLEDEGKTLDDCSESLREKVIAYFDRAVREQDDKLDGYAWLIKRLEAEAEACRSTAREFDEKARVRQRRVAWLKETILWFLQQRQVKQIATNRFKFARTANGGKTPVVIEDASLLPDSYLDERVERVPRTDDLREALETGVTIPGAVLGDRGFHLRIR
jgi:hypothetical protein